MNNQSVCVGCGHRDQRNGLGYCCATIVVDLEPVGRPCGCKCVFPVDSGTEVADELPRVKLIPVTSTWTCPNPDCERQNVYREGIVSALQSKCSACGTEVKIGALRAGTEVEAKAELEEQNDLVKAETAPCLPAVVTTKDSSLDAAWKIAQVLCDFCGEGGYNLIYHHDEWRHYRLRDMHVEYCEAHMVYQLYPDAATQDTKSSAAGNNPEG